MARETGIRTVDAIPSGALLPDEVAIKIGCAGCDSAIAGSYLAKGSRDERTHLRTEVEEALELTDIPGTVKNGGRSVDFEGSCNPGNCPGSDPQAAAIIREALSSI